jgi:hypothetical protein
MNIIEAIKKSPTERACHPCLVSCVSLIDGAFYYNNPGNSLFPFDCDLRDTILVDDNWSPFEPEKSLSEEIKVTPDGEPIYDDRLYDKVLTLQSNFRSLSNRFNDFLIEYNRLSFNATKQETKIEILFNFLKGKLVGVDALW